MSNIEPTPPVDATLPLHQRHERSFEQNRFVYPVLSRRSGGISIGINLNPDKVCNFDCIYCQVDRVSAAESSFVEIGQLLTELETMLTLVTSGELFQTDKFREVPPALRRLNDIAFSGDGEPTTFRNFDQIVADCAALKRKFGLDQVKLVLITNASMFHRPVVERGLAILDANQGEIWAKLDAGSDAYYHLVERTSIPFSRILENITRAAQQRPIVIQSMFLRIDGVGPDPAEQEAFCQRLTEVLAAGGAIKLVQIYTVARPPAEAVVTPLSNAEVDDLVALVRERTGLATVAYYGAV